ncbi:hypothetical protein [Aeromonas dhakensis]|uniref:hypothetical protein n=1 Tax=Aeromonas dhakensis TaxID=196024 RepID=UPI002B46AAB5|nr:hypothetical protein [Aeromonas dhakensis]
MSFNIGDQVRYKHYSLSRYANASMYVEFINGDEITCSYLEHDGSDAGVVKTVVLNANSLVVV